jgi:carboxyl-terminal processing protease
MKKKLTLILIVFITISSKLWAQESVTSSEAYEKAQAARAQARHLYNKDNPSQSDVQQSILILNNAIKYLDSLPIRELEQGNLYLKARKHDIYFDMVTANLIVHNNDKALDALEKMCDQGSYFFTDRLQTDSYIFRYDLIQDLHQQ